MTITIVGGGNPSGPTYPLQRSVRLRSSASAYFNRTPAGAGNRTTWTWSAWVKRGILNSGTTAYTLFSNNSANNDAGYTTIYFYQDALRITGFTTSWRQTTQVFRDPSAWYHIVVVWDTTQATANNRIRFYVNGVEITAFSTLNNPALNATGGINAATATFIGSDVYAGPTAFFDGYLEEINFIDGQALTPTSFGAYNAYGVWSPAKYTGTYGTNGFYLNFQDNSAATATTIGKDSSGNNNNWTPNNISVTAGITYDSMVDVPTNTSNTNANFAVFNPLAVTSVAATFAEGNLRVTTGAAGGNGYGTFAIPTSGKWYWEITAGSANNPMIGISAYLPTQVYAWQNANSVFYYNNGQKFVDGTGSAYGATYTTNDVIGVAVDVAASTITFYKNNVSQGSISHTFVDVFPCLTDGSSGSNDIFYANFGQRPFSYTPPTGFLSLNTFNLPTPTIPNGAAQFAATLYTGNGVASPNALSVTNTVNGASFQPDFVWIKSRSLAQSNILQDAVRGTSFFLESNTTTADQATGGGDVSSFNSNGFTLSFANARTNQNAATYVGWQWKANGTPAVINTAGSVPSTISVNTTSGFSIVTATSNGADPFTIGHGLGVAPKMVIFKNRSVVDAWYVAHTSLTNMSNCWLVLNTTAAAVGPSTAIFGAGPTSTTIGIRATSLAASGANIVAYCFAEIAGYSKFGSYVGNSSADGVFVYLGFRPRWLMIKNATLSGAGQSDWYIYDTARNPSNVTNLVLAANLSSAQVTATNEILDIVSNGFKLRGSSNVTNSSSHTYIYAAFAENPFNYSLAR